jgi:hypothetical protein
MLISEAEITERYESPLNLLNRLKLVSRSKADIVSIPKSSDVIENLDEKLNLGTAKSKAVSIMLSAMDELKMRLPEINRPEKLASIAAEMGKIVNSHQIKDSNDTRIGQIIVYAPSVVNEDIFEVVEARE